MNYCLFWYLLGIKAWRERDLNVTIKVKLSFKVIKDLISEGSLRLFNTLCMSGPMPFLPQSSISQSNASDLAYISKTIIVSMD